MRKDIPYRSLFRRAVETPVLTSAIAFWVQTGESTPVLCMNRNPAFIARRMSRQSSPRCHSHSVHFAGH